MWSGSSLSDLPITPVEPGFQSFLESAPDAVVVIDAHGKIVLVNALTERMFGYSRAEMLGQPVEILIPDRLRSRHEVHRNGYFKDMRTRPMGLGQPLAGKRKDGREFMVEISLSPLSSPHGPLVTSIIRDVSKRMEAEAKFRGLLESAPDGIVVVDSSGNIVIVNTQAERMFGYSREELLGKPIEILVPRRYEQSHVAQRDAYINAPRTRPMGAGRALMGRKKDGTEIPVEISLSPLETESGTLITSIIRDITEHRTAEERIKASLREKEVLLREIHHRVKNNLQVTSSLLKLQSSYIQDAVSKEMFSESQNRIRSMALVHEKLYQSTDLSRINMSDYAESLALLLMRSFGVSTDQIQLKVSRSDVLLTIETAIPCGLILNELVSNSLKHAFDNAAGGVIEVSVDKHTEREVALTVADNGKGLPADLDLEKAETLGMRLVRTLAEQLDGRIEIGRQSGTRITVIFPQPEKSAHEQAAHPHR